METRLLAARGEVTTRTSVNLPDDLAEWITQQAAENKRSISNQIVWLLEQARKEQGES